MVTGYSCHFVLSETCHLGFVTRELDLLPWSWGSFKSFGDWLVLTLSSTLSGSVLSCFKIRMQHEDSQLSLSSLTRGADVHLKLQSGSPKKALVYNVAGSKHKKCTPAAADV